MIREEQIYLSRTRVVLLTLPQHPQPSKEEREGAILWLTLFLPWGEAESAWKLDVFISGAWLSVVPIQILFLVSDMETDWMLLDYYLDSWKQTKLAEVHFLTQLRSGNKLTERENKHRNHQLIQKQPNHIKKERGFFFEGENVCVWAHARRENKFNGEKVFFHTIVLHPTRGRVILASQKCPSHLKKRNRNIGWV